MLRLAFEALFALLALCGLTFYLIALWSARSFQQEREPELSPGAEIPVSVLKPLKGADAQTYAALNSHCVQDYSEYQIIFGVNEATDEAVPLVRKIIAEFPQRDIRLVICSEALGANRKVSNLVHLLREAKHRHVLVNDGDIEVEPNYLRAVMAHFADSTVGMVTCLYKGRASQTLGSRLESLGIATDFAAGVLTARYLDDGLRFALGSTMAMSCVALEKIGGFNAVLDCLADDYQLGQRIANAGFKVVLTHEVVETSIPPYSFSQFWEHQLRWARTMRVSRPGGYLGVGTTYGLAWAILTLLIAPHAWWAWTILAAALIARIAVALRIGEGVLRDPQVKRDLWLIPFRDFFALATWVWSYAGDTVTWRGEKFRLEQGRMVPVSSSVSRSIKDAAGEVDSRAQRR